MKRNPLTTEKGFTIIELMISMSIFTVIITMGIGAVLSAISQHNQNEKVRSVMDNVTFAMEDMARNMRAGTDFRCVINISESYSAGVVTGTPVRQDCASGYKIRFKAPTGDVISYTIGSTASQLDLTQPIYLWKTVNNSTAIRLAPMSVTIDPFRSGFFVVGSAGITTDNRQPSISINLSGEGVYKNVTTTFELQTTVVSRQLDT